MEKLVDAIREAAAAKRWDIVHELNAALRAALRKKTDDHKKSLSRSLGARKAYEALEGKRKSGPLLAAFAEDPRFGSLRAYADARGIDKSSLSGYARGRSPCPLWVDLVIRHDFPELEWDWPAGIAEKRPTVDAVVEEFLKGHLGIRDAAREAGVPLKTVLERLENFSRQAG
jgi:hypothetical protein